MPTKLIDSYKKYNEIDYVCFDCGNNAKERYHYKYESRGTTVRNGICNVCKDWRPVAHVKHFGYPVFEVNVTQEEGKQ